MSTVRDPISDRRVSGPLALLETAWRSLLSLRDPAALKGRPGHPLWQPRQPTLTVVRSRPHGGRLG